MMRSSVLRNELGLSLVELLISMVVACIVIAAIYRTFTDQAKSYSIQEHMSAMQQNARVSMDMIARDVRMAGFEEVGFDVPDSNAIVAINSSVGPDSIMVSDGQGVATGLTANVGGGASAIAVLSLDPNSDGANDFAQGGGVIVSDGNQTEGFQITSIDEATGTITLSGTLVNPYLAVDTVVVPATLYEVNGTNLRRNGSVLAGSIEDLQFAYIFDDGGEANAPDNTDGDDTNDSGDIRSVRINVLVRTRAEHLDFTGSRPGIEDHAAGGTIDHYRRRLLTTVVKVRNLGL